MGRKKQERSGKRITIYLTPERLDRLGPEPTATLYSLIDGYDHGNAKIPSISAKMPKMLKIPASEYVCERHARHGYTACSCPKPSK